MRKVVLLLILFSSLISCNEAPKKAKKGIVKNVESEVKDTLRDSIPKEKTRNSAQPINLNNYQYEQALILENFLIDKIPSKDFITITEKTVIFRNPDSQQIEQFKKEIGEEDFYIVADDNSWYQFEAEEYFEKKKIKTLHPQNRYLKFITRDKKVYNFDTKAKFSGWLTILFRPDSLPKIINPTGIEQEDTLYFGK